ncbi:MAG: hypothetical protein IPQ01_09130 [Zoogloea sp.]|nr:hypothetical protein [Zoogloea sp.]
MTGIDIDSSCVVVTLAENSGGGNVHAGFGEERCARRFRRRGRLGRISGWRPGDSYESIFGVDVIGSA